MKPIICVYCEGNDTKLAVFIKERDRIKLLRTSSFDVAPSLPDGNNLSGLQIEDDGAAIDNMVGDDLKISVSNFGLINSGLKGINLANCDFIPALTEPAIYYHVFEKTGQAKSSKLTQEIISDIQETKNVTIDKENLGYIELADSSLLSVFLSGEVSCLKMISSLARYNGKRYYRIPAVKSAEISLAYYVAKRKKFFPDDSSLIVYIGKEYSKLIFLQGRQIKHIGSTLDIGTVNLHTYDVYFSKILLEMENGGINSLDNIIVCGEDDSENLILSFYGTFPEANVSRLEFDDMDLSAVKEDEKEKLSQFSVPLAVANDYFDGLEGAHKGINLLPKYVKEDQKVFQFAWHGYVMLPLLFIAALLITIQVLRNQSEIGKLNDEIDKRTILQRQNQKTLSQISEIQQKISGFNQTQSLLDSASMGAGVWSDVLSKISTFFKGKDNIWVTKLVKGNDDKIIFEGYATSRAVLTDLAYYLKEASLNSIMNEVIRDKNVYKFNITFFLSRYYKDTE